MSSGVLGRLSRQEIRLLESKAHSDFHTCPSRCHIIKRESTPNLFHFHQRGYECMKFIFPNFELTYHSRVEFKYMNTITQNLDEI